MIDLDRGLVTRNGEPVHLARLEFELLALLARNPGRIVTRKEALREVWKYNTTRDTRTVDAHVASIRRKLGDGCPHISAVYGSGYRLDL